MSSSFCSWISVERSFFSLNRMARISCSTSRFLYVARICRLVVVRFFFAQLKYDRAFLHSSSDSCSIRSVSWIDDTSSLHGPRFSRMFCSTFFETTLCCCFSTSIARCTASTLISLSMNFYTRARENVAIK